MSWKYTGKSPAIFPNYLDRETGETLHAEPGKVYDIKAADGTEYTVPAEEKGADPITKRLPVPPEGPWERVATTSATTTTGSSAASSATSQGKE